MVSASPKRAVIVGAGPVGGLTAVHLAEQGWDVTLLEKRATLPGRPPRDDPRAYCLMLGQRGLGALLAKGMDLSALTEPANGLLKMQRFEVGGKGAMAFEVPVDRLKPERLMCYRDELNSHITREALRLQPSIRLQLDAQVSHVDLDRQQLTLSQGGKPSEVLQYDLLVGSDGAGSCVRQALAEVLPPGFCRIRKADNAYAMTPLPAAEPGTKTHSLFQMHAFKGPPAAPELGTVYYSDRGDGDRRVTLAAALPVIDLLRQDPTALDAVLDDDKRFPTLPRPVREGLRDYLHTRPEYQKLSRWTLLSQLTGPKVVLLGDAAHSMSPVLGQACNCGLEDAQVFAGILKASGGDVDRALQRYNRERLPDVKALLALNQLWAARMGIRTEEQNFWEMVSFSSQKMLLILGVISSMILFKLAPSLFPRPALMRATMGTLPYRRVFTEVYAVVALLAAVCLIPAARLLTL